MQSSNPYGGNYYEHHLGESLRSARIVLPLLWQYIKPASVLDVGCGTGAWLKVCHELGSSHLFGFDGDWNSQAQMIDAAIQFQSIDLNGAFVVDSKPELAMSLEVAEHLEPSSASQFIQCLTKASDAVLFSAAYTAQGGTNHLNEQLHTYWAKLFLERDYAPFDLFRPFLWGNEGVGFCYRQNIFLYCRRGSDSYNAIKSAGCRELAEISFMNCVHPALYNLRRRTIDISFTEHVRDIVPSLYRAIRRRITRSEATGTIPPVQDTLSR